jgi:hypothetical protein
VAISLIAHVNSGVPLMLMLVSSTSFSMTASKARTPKNIRTPMARRSTIAL